MIVNNIQFTVSVKQLNIDDKNLRREIEDCLQDFKLSYIASPPIPPEIGKIPSLMFGQTGGGHSHIRISEQTINLFVTFDEKFNSEIDKCFGYAYDKIDSISKLVDKVEDNDSLLGVVVQYIFDNEPDAISLINQDSIKSLGVQSFVNFSKKFSLIFGERCYLNFDLSSLKFREDDENKVSIVVDINNRYGIEYKNELDNQSDIDAIKNLHKAMTKKFFDTLLRKGELNLNEIGSI